MLWVEAFIRNPVLVTTCTSFAALFPTKDRSTIDFISSDTSAFAIRFEILVDKFVLFLVTGVVDIGRCLTVWNVGCYITNIKSLTAASECFLI